MKVFQFDNQFIIDHMDELIHLEDYVPINFIVYDKHHERDDFLKSKNLMSTLREMDQLLDEKCKHSKNPINAYDSIIIEWLECHPEFEGIIAAEYIVDYQNMKNSNEYIDFNNLLDVKISAGNDVELDEFNYDSDKLSVKDDSSIKFPDFNKMKECYDKYPNTLLANYLAYLV